MHSRQPTIRDMPPPPHIVGLQHFTTYAEIDEILRSRSFRQGSHQESQAFFGRSLLTIDGDEHFERRRLEAPLFAKIALDYYEHTELIPLIHKTLEECRANRSDDGVVRADLCVVLRTMLARIAAATTGIDGVDTPERTDAFREYVELLGTGATVEWSTEDHGEVIQRILKVRDAFDREFFAPSVARRRALIERHRRGEIGRDELPVDLITMLYLHWNDDWDEGLPIREACLFLVAATQTTTHAVPHLIAHLDEWFDSRPEDRAKVSDGVFIKRAAHEALRLHQPSPALLRIATEDFTLSNGKKIAAGERVACLFTPANRDTSAFGADAREFNPYREVSTVKPWGLTFGGGQHICIGRTLVTGLSARTDNDEGTDGTVVNIAGALYNAGIEIDPDDPPTYTQASHHDAYGRFPMLLTRL
ncbi:MAG: cytochrome P450 [bacterium]|nr:cytochrome P450 [bacterium]